VRHLFLFATLFFFLSSVGSTQSDLYQIQSLDDQFVVYGQDPGVAQESALLAEQVRTDLFETLGWINFSQAPIQIWIKEESKVVSPAVSTTERKEGVWVKKIEVPLQPDLNEEILPREIIKLLLGDLAFEKIDLGKLRPQIELPLWVIEGLRWKVARSSQIKNISVEIGNLELLLQSESLPQDPLEKQVFAQTAGSFVDFLFSLPEGKQKLKVLIRSYSQPKSLFASIYQSDFKSNPELQLAWNQFLGDQQVVHSTPTKPRRQLIMQYLDALEAE